MKMVPAGLYSLGVTEQSITATNSGNKWNLHTTFQSGLHQFTVPPMMHKCSPFSTSLPAFIFCLFDDNNFNKSEVLAHSGFDLI